MNRTTPLNSASLFARPTRRAFLGLLGAGGAAAALRPAITLGAGPQPAPVQAPVEPTAGGGAGPSYLFLQNAPSGSLTPTGPNQWRLLMNGFNGTTLYFADRPARAAGEMPTDFFFKALGLFSKPNDLPNAAIVAPGQEGPDTIIVELANPAWDATAKTLAYDVRSLDPNGSGLEWFVGANRLASALPATLDEINLFIDDATAGSPQYCQNLGNALTALEATSAALQLAAGVAEAIPPPFGEIIAAILEIAEAAVDAAKAGVEIAYDNNCGNGLRDVFAASTAVAKTDSLGKTVKAVQKAKNNSQKAATVTDPGVSLDTISQITGKPLPGNLSQNGLSPSSSLQQTLDTAKNKAPADKAAKITQAQGHLNTAHSNAQKAHDSL